MRTGVIAKKIGMSRYFTEEGAHYPVTLLKMESCQVVSVKTEEKDGYNAVQLGVGEAKTKNVSKALRGHFAKAKITPKQKLAEFRVAKDALLNPGDEISPAHYVTGQIIDVAGTTKGKGFSGGMKRHGFGGLEATHGVSISHRSHGSTGQCQDPGRVFKGKKMAGQYGNVNKTVQNLQVVETDEENGIIVVYGAVPGPKDGYVFVTDANKFARHPEAPYPAGIKGAVNKNTEADKAEAPAQEQAQEEAQAAPAENAEAKAEEAPQAEAAEKKQEEAPKEEAPKADESNQDKTGQ